MLLKLLLLMQFTMLLYKLLYGLMVNSAPDRPGPWGLGHAPRSHEQAALARFPSEAPSAAAASRDHRRVPEFGVARLGVAGSAGQCVLISPAE